MSLNTLKQRQYLYKQTFLKWKVEQRLSTMEQTAIETSLSVHKFGSNATEPNFKKLCESLSDIETMIEVAEMTFPTLRGEMDALKKEKLTVLKKQTALKEEAEEIDKKAEAIRKQASEVPQQVKNKSGSWIHNVFFFWKTSKK
jgi:peptidoglycan hydrolase CwlO-like protein